MSELTTKEGRDWLYSHLRMGPVKVVFTKADGTERTMVCTLQPDALPPIKEKVDTKKKTVNEEIVSVYDIESEGWRSFRLDSVKVVSFDL